MSSPPQHEPPSAASGTNASQGGPGSEHRPAATGTVAAGTDATGTAATAYEREIVLFDVWQQQLERDGEAAAIPAATVVLLRDGPGGLESLMLRRNSRIAFGGMWVFPGGRIDPGDYDETGDLIAAARRAAVREAHEEAAVSLDPARLVQFSYWIPPPIAPKRFATWFFAAAAPASEITIDDGEIINHEWMTPADAMRRRDAAEIELIAPTWVTLHTVGRFRTVADALDGLARRKPRRYLTRMAKGTQGPISMWHGDAGYETSDPSVRGPRHRLEITPNGYEFDESGYRDPN